MPQSRAGGPPGWELPSPGFQNTPWPGRNGAPCSLSSSCLGTLCWSLRGPRAGRTRPQSPRSGEETGRNGQGSSEAFWKRRSFGSGCPGTFFVRCAFWGRCFPAKLCSNLLFTKCCRAERRCRCPRSRGGPAEPAAAGRRCTVWVCAWVCQGRVRVLSAALAWAMGEWGRAPGSPCHPSSHGGWPSPGLTGGGFNLLIPVPQPRKLPPPQEKVPDTWKPSQYLVIYSLSGHSPGAGLLSQAAPSRTGSESMAPSPGPRGSRPGRVTNRA